MATDAIKRKALVQELHTKLVKAAVAMQANIDEFPPAMYTDERIASFGISLGKLFTAYILEMLMDMDVSPQVLAEKLCELTHGGKFIVIELQDKKDKDNG